MTAPDFQSEPVAHYSVETIETLAQAGHTAKLYDRRGQKVLLEDVESKSPTSLCHRLTAGLTSNHGRSTSSRNKGNDNEDNGDY